MNIQDIENMTAAELKEKTGSVVEAIAEQDGGTINGRYLKTLIDAKERDEKLAEQGKTITMLQEAHTENVKQIAELESTNGLLNEQNVSLAEKMTVMITSHRAEIAATGEAHDEDLVNLNSSYDQKLENLTERLENVTAQLVEQQQRGDRLKSQAEKNQSALSKASSILNDAISFNQIDAADTGN